MIPPFSSAQDDAGHHPLPPGIHLATWTEVAQRFGTGPTRTQILDGLLLALRALEAAGCKRVFIDGSFVTSKPVPGDFDGCWDPEGVRFNDLDPTLKDFSNKRAAQKSKFLGEMFLSTSPANALGQRFIDFFQRDRDGQPKGIVQINLEDLP